MKRDPKMEDRVRYQLCVRNAITYNGERLIWEWVNNDDEMSMSVNQDTSTFTVQELIATIDYIYLHVDARSEFKVQPILENSK